MLASSNWQVLVILLLEYLSYSVCIDANCDYQQDLAIGQQYYIYNQEYPNNYGANTSCRWSARSPVGTVIVLSCNEVNIPSSYYCQNDRLLVSTTSAENFYNARYYCGRVSFTTVSERNFLTIGLFAGFRSHGGNFSCTIAAVRVAPTWCTCSKQPYSEETKIMGGQETRVNEFPWMAALIDRSTHEAFCGAEIISDRYALTAAHCLLHQTPQNLALLVGDHNLETGNDTAAAALYPISSFNQHPSYDSRDHSNDVGVVKTTYPIKFSAAVGPVCLPFRFGMKSFERETVTDLGWGFTDVGGNKADALQKVNLTVVSNYYCQQSLRQKISATQICTYAHGKDACFSDSGGPVLWKAPRKKRYFLVGIISFGIFCGTTTPGVNARVTSFLPWIVSVTNDTPYCFK